MSFSKILFFATLLTLGWSVSNEAVAQTTQSVGTQLQNSNDQTVNPDIAPVVKESEKPYVIGEDGQKIYFLSQPAVATETEKEKSMPVSADPKPLNTDKQSSKPE